MGLGLRNKIKKAIPRDLLHTSEGYNETGPNNPTQKIDKDTSFSLRPITLENIDEAIYRTFNRKFRVGEEELGLIQLDADVAAHKHQHPEKWNKAKEFLNIPYFVYWRSTAQSLYRTSPSFKPIVYTVPTKKPQGVVYEEYIMPAPEILKFPMVFKFVTALKEHTNQMEEHFLKLFRNKRILVVLDGERFELKPTDQNARGEVEMEKRGGEGQKLYIMTWNLELIGYLRDIKDVQKREKVNTFSIQISEKIEKSDKSLLVINQTESRL